MGEPIASARSEKKNSLTQEEVATTNTSIKEAFSSFSELFEAASFQNK